MNPARALEPGLDHVEQLPRGTDGRDQLGEVNSPYLTSDEAWRYLRFPSIRAFYRWTERHTVPTCRRGRVLLFERRALDAFVRGEDWTKRRRGVVAAHGKQSAPRTT